MAEVFISYSQEVRPLVAPSAERLAELGVDAWFDREIPAGESFGAVIRARLKEAKAVLVCWSPEAIESQWVDSEADYAREQGTYVPVFVAPCGLLPPFNRIHTDDLSRWKGEANDPSWIKLVDRIALLIKREGVAAAARAHASPDERARYDFARRYPDEPAARKIWSTAEASHRSQFEQRLAEARMAAEARIDAERAALEARLTEAAPAFEIWLADERRAAAKGPRPDPLDLVEQAERGEDPRVRDEIAALRGALAQAKTKEGELDAARAEVARLSKEVAALKERLPNPPAMGEKSNDRKLPSKEEKGNSAATVIQTVTSQKAERQDKSLAISQEAEQNVEEKAIKVPQSKRGLFEIGMVILCTILVSFLLLFIEINISDSNISYDIERQALWILGPLTVVSGLYARNRSNPTNWITFTVCATVTSFNIALLFFRLTISNIYYYHIPEIRQHLGSNIINGYGPFVFAFIFAVTVLVFYLWMSERKSHSLST
jgi:hypothetical protein